MSDAMKWTVMALAGQTKVPDIKGLPSVTYTKRK